MKTKLPKHWVSNPLNMLLANTAVSEEDRRKHYNLASVAWARLADGVGITKDVDYLIAVTNVCFIRAGAIPQVNQTCEMAGKALLRTTNKLDSAGSAAVVALLDVYTEILSNSTYKEMYDAAGVANKKERT